MTVSHSPLRCSVPSTIRETFELFAFFRPELGIEGLVANLPLEGMTPRQVYYAAHGRPPDSIGTAILQLGITAADVYAAALRSEEFRENFVARFLEAFQEKKRLLFIHVPKCAGSDLSSHLVSRFPSLNSQILDPDWASSDQFFAAIRDVVLEVNVSDSIYVHGHNNLAFYRKWELIRFRDEIFTVLRDPVSRVISQVNYVLTRIFSDEVPVAPDTRGWRDEFAIDDNQLTEAKAAVHELAHRSLRDEGVVVPNVICQYLGRGTCDSAVEQTVINDIEITETSRYDAWSQARWGVGRPTRKNASDEYVRFTDFLPADQEYIREICNEDLKFYNLLIERLEQSDSLSIKGNDILPSPAAVAMAAARPAGPAGTAGTAVLEPEQPAPEPSEKVAEQAKNVLAGSETAPRQLELISNVAPAPELPLGELMMCFESIGENCEFGLVQRRCGAEPLGLFRFASAPLPKLLAGLEARFEGLSDPDNLEVQLSPNQREYMVHDRKFQLLYALSRLGDGRGDDRGGRA
jgi:hypothetical protein